MQSRSARKIYDTTGAQSYGIIRNTKEISQVLKQDAMETQQYVDTQYIEDVCQQRQFEKLYQTNLKVYMFVRT